MFAGAFTPGIRAKARDYALRFGEQLRAEGYRGYFELDFLIEEETGEVFLGELNPRITGVTSLTNHSAFAHADAPLFLFHLLEFLDVEVELDVEAINQRWASPDYIDSWSQMVVKHTRIRSTSSPRRRDRTSIALGRKALWCSCGLTATGRRSKQKARPSFFGSAVPGDYRYKGADLGILVTRGRLMTADFRLTDRALAWIRAVRGSFASDSMLAETLASGFAAIPTKGFGYRQVLS